MNIEKYRDYTTEDFVLDNYFLNWAIDPHPESDLFWRRYMHKFPEKRDEVNDAVLIIKSIRAVEPEISQERLRDLYKKIDHLKSSDQRRYLRYLKVAAIFIFLISVAGLLYYYSSNKYTQPFEILDTNMAEKGKVILPDGTVSEFESDKTEIQQIAGGAVTINNDTVTQAKKEAKHIKNELIRIIIPYGKRSEITLADGTRVWLNSGSQFSYPAEFTKGLREVYLSGEAFFDVAKDQSSPFQVITNEIKVTVKGTRFNVISYANDPTVQTVLLSGKIEAGKKKLFSGAVTLEPGERIIYDKQNEDISKDKVDVNLYSSWIDGYLIFEEEPLVEIFKKLERYYNIRILTEKLSGRITFSGKLDLADDLEKVLKNIAFSAPFSVECDDGIYLIKPKD